MEGRFYCLKLICNLRIVWCAYRCNVDEPWQSFCPIFHSFFSAQWPSPLLATFSWAWPCWPLRAAPLTTIRSHCLRQRPITIAQLSISTWPPPLGPTLSMWHKSGCLRGTDGRVFAVQLRLKGLRAEGLSFRVARAQLTAAMVGTYGYKTKLDRTPPTDFTYTVPVRLHRRRLEHVVGVLGLSVCAHRRVYLHGLRCPAPLAQRPLRRHMAQRPRPAGGEYGLPAPLGRHHTRRYIRQRPHSRCTIKWSWLLIECIL